MISIKGLHKFFNKGNQNEIHVINGVDLELPDKGMVAIFGKSGCGKTTLLNVIGGLDGYDGGEFVIMGKSSKDFGGSDFDAYRNTFIGFIFQEYNILDDFTVGANIGLALELQGKKATNEKINDILDKVDLTNYAKRKPNELSGGQKQRVAIARALVKEPQIIMADEPTGALDSGTGKQIFDTLKKLSREKLVLVVSHDRDFAEKYADRIIELADGVVISDVTKHSVPSTRLSDGVHRVGNNIFRIEKGYRLTADDLKLINDYIEQNEGDIILSGDVRVNQELRSAAGITEDGGTSVFEHTNDKKDFTLKAYDGKKTKFIKSRLPMKNALRIGASGLKHKKFRLVLTILLSTVAFAMFGLADTMAVYQKITAATDSIIDSHITNASVTLGVRHDYYYNGEHTDRYYETKGMNNGDIENLKRQTGLDFIPVFTGSSYEWDSGFSIASNLATLEQNQVYTAKISGLVDIGQQQLDKMNLTLLAGRLPDKTGEIVISELTLRTFNQYGFKNTDHNESIQAEQLTDATNILGKHITLMSSSGNMSRTFVIVGVVDTHFDYQRYDSFLPSDTPTEGGIADMVLALELANELSYGLHALGIVRGEDITDINNEIMASSVQIGTQMSGWNTDTYITLSSNSDGDDKDEGAPQYSYSFRRIATSDDISKLNVKWINEQNKTLGANDVIVSRDIVNSLLPQDVTLTVSIEDFGRAVDAIYGNGAFAATNNEYTLGSRLDEAACKYHLTAYISDMLDDGKIFKSVLDHAQSYGEYISTKNDALQYWYRWWTESGQYDPPLYDYNGNKQMRNMHEIYDEARLSCIMKMLPYVVNEIYGFNLPAPIPSDALGINTARSVCDRIMSNISEQNPSVSLSSHDIYSILSWIYDSTDYRNMKIWNDTEFRASLIADWGYNEEEFRGYDENTLKSVCYDYYRYTYKINHQNELDITHTEQELYEMASNMLFELGDVNLSALLSNITFNHVIYDYDLQLESAVKSYTLNVVGWIENVEMADGSIFNPYYDTVVSDTLHADFLKWYADEESKFMDPENTYRDELAPHEDGIWMFAIAPMGSDRATVQQLVEMSYDDETALRFSLQNAVMNTLSSFNEFIEIGAQIFIYIGLGFAVFSALLLMNFIAISISYKKREIGILRAVGARSSDVFKIFFSEAAIIALINFALSLTAVVVATTALNGWMRSSGINITLLNFGIRQVVLMLLISIGVAAVASFFPVYKTARRKPIDAIRDK